MLDNCDHQLVASVDLFQWRSEAHICDFQILPVDMDSRRSVLEN